MGHRLLRQGAPTTRVRSDGIFRSGTRRKAPACVSTMAVVVVAFLATAVGASGAAGSNASGGDDDGIGRICNLIEAGARENGLPPTFLARLVWKESRFDADAVSPAGAEGIAQFMPGTAKLRGLSDPFDATRAIRASAAYLADLKSAFGNLGLAAAAYNAGERRVSDWLSTGGFLPIETEDYVLAVLGEPVDSFARRSHEASIRPLEKGTSFQHACRELPAVMATTVPMSHVTVKPWGVQVAGSFRRSAAVRQWQRTRAKFPDLLSKYEPTVSHVRSPRGRRGIYAVRIGADTRTEAGSICRDIHSTGGACVVLKNR